jgi:DNA-binding transcriptional LysR family regulator
VTASLKESISRGERASNGDFHAKSVKIWAYSIGDSNSNVMDRLSTEIAEKPASRNSQSRRSGASTREDGAAREDESTRAELSFSEAWPGCLPSLADTLKGVPLLTYTAAFDMLQNAAWFQSIRSTAGVALETNSTHTLLAAAAAGAGVAVLPRFVARDHESLVAVSDDVANHDVWLITHPEFRRDPKVRAATDFLKGIAADPVRELR